MYDKLLYKIKPINQLNIDNIENDEVWVPKASSLNDPYDCSIAPYLSSDLENDKLEELLENLGDESQIFNRIKNTDYYQALDKTDRNWIAYNRVCERIRDVGILSFIDTPYNIVTWSHYGEEHKGFCIEYTPTSEDPVELFKIYFAGYRLKPVSYTNILPRITWKEFLRCPQLLLETILTTKYRDWAYENETRMITHNHLGNTAIKLETLGLKINRIFLGCESKHSNELTSLIEVCTRKNIPLIKLKKHAYSFTLSEADQ